MTKTLSKVAAMTWKRRWFVLTQPSEGRPATFAYYSGPNVTTEEPVGLVLLNASAQIFMTDKTKKPHCFCIQSQGAKDNKAITTVLAATSNDEVKKWMRSLQSAINSSGGVVDQSAKLSKLAAMGGTMTSTKMGANKTAMFENLKRLDEPELIALPIKKLAAPRVATTLFLQRRTPFRLQPLAPGGSVEPRSVLPSPRGPHLKLGAAAESDALATQVELLKYMDVKVPKEALEEKLRDGKPDKRPLVKLVINQIALEKMTTTFAAPINNWMQKAGSREKIAEKSDG